MNEEETYYKPNLKVYFSIGGAIVLILVGLLSYDTMMFEYNRINGNTDYFIKYLENRSSSAPDTSIAYSRKTKVREAVLILLEDPSASTYKSNLEYIVSSFYSLLDKGHYIYANEYSIAFRERYVIFEDKERILQYYFAGDSKVADIVFPLIKDYSKDEVVAIIGITYSQKIQSMPKYEGRKDVQHQLFNPSQSKKTFRKDVKRVLDRLYKMQAFSSNETLRKTLEAIYNMNSVETEYNDILKQRVPNYSLSNLAEGIRRLEEERHPILDKLDKFDIAVAYWCFQFDKDLNSN